MHTKPYFLFLILQAPVLKKNRHSQPANKLINCDGTEYSWPRGNRSRREPFRRLRASSERRRPYFRDDVEFVGSLQSPPSMEPLVCNRVAARWFDAILQGPVLTGSYASVSGLGWLESGAGDAMSADLQKAIGVYFLPFPKA